MEQVDVQVDAGGVSVVTRTLGHLPFLRRCFGALRGATDAAVDMEWIIVDDGCADPAALEDFVKLARDTWSGPIRLVATRGEHRGVAANAGLRAARYEFLHFLDDDDVVLPAFYTVTRSRLCAEPALGGVAVKCEAVHEMLDADGTYREVGRHVHYPEIVTVSLARFAVNQGLPLVSVLFRRSVLEAAGGFDPDFAVCEDYDLLIRVLLQRDIAVVNQVLMRFHQRVADGGPGNSPATTDFANQDAYFRNAMLRRDINAGRLGPGWLLAVAELSAGSVKTNQILSQLYKFRPLNRAFALLRRR